jgi:hypothetical protein
MPKGIMVGRGRNVPGHLRVGRPLRRSDARGNLHDAFGVPARGPAPGSHGLRARRLAWRGTR